jgi:hypothetical protein
MSLNNISLINLNSQFNPFYSSINIDSSGNVGIGKSNPLEILDVSGNIKFSGNIIGSGYHLTSLNATNITSGVLSVNRGGTGATTLTAGSILVGNGTSTLIQPSNLTWNTGTNTLSATNFVGSGAGLTSLTATNITGNINVSQGGTGLTTLTTGRILVGNGTSALTQSANLTWDNTNNRLGIGITNPQYILDIQGVQPTLRLLDTRSDGNAIISLNEFTDNYGYDIAYIGSTDNKLYIRGYNASATPRIDMTFDRATGNVGIGTTTPNTKLDVNGNISLKSDSASSLFWGGTLTSLGRANGSGDFSSSAVAGDLVLRSVGKLILQSGTGIGAIVIDTSNNINIDSGILYIDASNNNVGIGTTQPNKKLHVTGDTRIEGSLIVNGTLTQINTNVGTTEQLLITNDGTGPALIVNQTGAQPIIEIQDDGLTCFKILDGGNVGIGTATKVVSVDISGNLKLSGSITGSGSGLTSLNASNITGNINVAQGGTGLTTLTSGQILIGGANVIQTPNLTWNSSTNTLSATNFVGSGTGLAGLNATNISSGTLLVSQGGTGATTLTSGQILIGGANVIQSANLSWNNTSNTLSATNFIGSGAGLTALTATNITGNINVAQGGTGATTLTSGQILVGNGTSALTQSANLTWDNTNNRLGIGKTNPTTTLDVNGTVTGTLFSGSGASLTALNASNISSGSLTVSNGGTGLTALTSGQLLIGNGTSALTQTANLTWDNTNNRLGIGKTNPGYVLDVNGAINTTELRMNGTIFTGSRWTIGTSNKIYYNTANIGIGTTDPLSLLDINATNYTGALLTLDAGIINATTQMARSIGKPLMKIGKTSYSTTAGDYYGIGFGYSPTSSDFNCAEIGTIITSVVGKETGDIVLSTRPDTTNVAATERMRIWSNGAVTIQNAGGALPVNINYMRAGSLTIGNITQNYGGGTTSWNSAVEGTAGLLMECLDNTELMIHDIGNSLHSFMRYTTNGNFQIGRNAGHGVANVSFAGNVCIGKATPGTALDVVGTITGTLFSGSGASLTALNASNISSGSLTVSNGGTGCTSLNTAFFDTSGGVLSLKSGSGTGSSQWTTLNNNIYFNTANVGIGITNPTYKLHVEDGILFVGDSMFLNNSSSNIANNYSLLFDNTYNGTTGSGIAANKIRLMNDTSNNILAGFGIENNSITYHSGSSGSHTFYSGTSSSNYGTGRFQIDQSGNITCTGDFAAFTSISDKRLKTNIIKLDSSMDIIKKLNPVKFFWKYNDFILENKQGTEDVGFIAQEIEEVIPLAAGEYKVINSEETYKNIKYERIIPYLVKSMQELIDKVDRLEQEIVRLKCNIQS